MMGTTPYWANLRLQKWMRHLKQLCVVIFFSAAIVSANWYVHVEATRHGEIQGPELIDWMLFRRIVKNGGKEKVTLFGTYTYDPSDRSWK